MSESRSVYNVPEMRRIRRIHIVAKGQIIDGTKECARQEGLMHCVLAFQERIGHAIVICRQLQGLNHHWISEHFVLLVGRKVHQSPTQLVNDLDALNIGKTGDILGRQVASHVNITTFKL